MIPQVKKFKFRRKHWKVNLRDFNLAVIDGVSGAAAAFIILPLVLVLTLYKIVRRQRKRIAMTNEEINEFMKGVAAGKVAAKGINGLFVLPYDTWLEIPKSDITFHKAS